VALTSRLVLNMLRNSFGINIGGWAGDFNIQRTNFCRITTCNERCINRVHLTFSLYLRSETREKNNRHCRKYKIHIYEFWRVFLTCLSEWSDISTQWLLLAHLETVTGFMLISAEFTEDTIKNDKNKACFCSF
jgi:hypothetical protein